MPDFKPMLAAKAREDKLRFPLYAQPKLDGIRCTVVGGRPLTRTLKEVPNREVFNALSRPEFEGLDGELIVGDPNAEDAYRRTTSFVMARDKTGEPWVFHVFDVATDKFTFMLRLSMLDGWGVNWGHLSKVETRWIESKFTLDAYEQEIVDAGGEGVILRNPNAFYKFGRASATKGELLKLKRFEDFEAVIVGYVEEQHNGNEAVTNALGRTERSSAAAGKVGKGTLGKLILRTEDGVEFGCGTGFTAEERATLWAQREHLPGLFAKIKSFPLGVKDKPRFPVFLGFRDPADFDARVLNSLSGWTEARA